MKKTLRKSVQRSRHMIMAGALMLFALCFATQVQAQTDINTQKQKEQNDQLISQTQANTMKMMEEARKKGEKIAEPVKNTTPVDQKEKNDKNAGIVIERKDQQK